MSCSLVEDLGYERCGLLDRHTVDIRADGSVRAVTNFQFVNYIIILGVCYFDEARQFRFRKVHFHRMECGDIAPFLETE